MYSLDEYIKLLNSKVEPYCDSRLGFIVIGTEYFGYIYPETWGAEEYRSEMILDVMRTYVNAANACGIAFYLVGAGQRGFVSCETSWIRDEILCILYDYNLCTEEGAIDRGTCLCGKANHHCVCLALVHRLLFDEFGD